jgi:hypothetical protein
MTASQWFDLAVIAVAFIAAVSGCTGNFKQRA